MPYTLSSIQYYPVKSLSCSNLKKTLIKKNLGILNDRLFSFSRNISYENAKLMEKFPKKRKLNNFLTLKNSPVLNKYKFTYEDSILTLFMGDQEIISTFSEDKKDHFIICNKLLELEKTLTEPIFLLKNENYPFFDTTHSNIISNTISLININSVKDFEKKSNETLELERFRGNFYIDGLDAWEERSWVHKIIKINDVPFKVQKNISRCSATNLKPNTSQITINLPIKLNKYYNHFDLGIYLEPLDDGEINLGDHIILADAIVN